MATVNTQNYKPKSLYILIYISIMAMTLSASFIGVLSIFSSSASNIDDALNILEIVFGLSMGSLSFTLGIHYWLKHPKWFGVLLIVLALLIIAGTIVWAGHQPK